MNTKLSHEYTDFIHEYVLESICHTQTMTCVARAWLFSSHAHAQSKGESLGMRVEYGC